MKKKTIDIAVLVLSLLIGTAYSHAGAITMENIVQRAREKNIELKIYKNRVAVAKENAVDARVWDYPVVGYEGSEMEAYFTVGQNIPLAGRFFLAGKKARVEQLIAVQEYNAKELDIIAQAKNGYWMYFIITKKIEIYKENLELTKKFLDISKALYQAGKANQADMVKAKLELSKMQEMIVFMEKYEKSAATSDLGKLLADESVTDLGDPVEPGIQYSAATVSELVDTALKNQPVLHMKALAKDKYGISEKMARRGWFNDIMAEYKINEDKKKNMLMAKIALPLYFKKQVSGSRSARLEKDIAAFDEGNEEITITQNIHELWLKTQSNKERLAVYTESILPLSRQRVELDESLYRSGKVSMLDLLESQSELLTNTVTYYELLQETAMAQITLEQLIGVPAR